METQAARRVSEVPRPVGAGDGPDVAGADRVPLWENPEWRERFPWLAQGTTAEGDEARPFDLSLFGDGCPRDVMERWWALGRSTNAARLVHAQQVHGPVVRVHAEGPPGLQVSPGTDGHVTRIPGVLLTVSVADCVPIFLVDPDRRGIALLHGGWRGIAAGILERGLEVLSERLAVPAGDLYLHVGPAICGDCYEVGPEVHTGLGLPEPEGPQTVDLREVVVDHACRAGVGQERITISSHCTRCGDSPFFSHRGGRAERQVAVLGIRSG